MILRHCCARYFTNFQDQSQTRSSSDGKAVCSLIMVLADLCQLIFVCMTNILLITSLISILSDSFSKVIAHAKLVNLKPEPLHVTDNCMQRGVPVCLLSLRSWGMDTGCQSLHRNQPFLGFHQQSIDALLSPSCKWAFWSASTRFLIFDRTSFRWSSFAL